VKEGAREKEIESAKESTKMGVQFWAPSAASPAATISPSLRLRLGFFGVWLWEAEGMKDEGVPGFSENSPLFLFSFSFFMLFNM